jgi:predicted nucleic acid-binding protein
VGWVWRDPTCQFIGRDRILRGDLEWAEAIPWAGAGVDFSPVGGDLKGFIEVFTGRDLVTGEDLGAWRWAGLVFLSELRHLRHLDTVGRAARQGAHLGDAGRGVRQGAHVGSSPAHIDPFLDAVHLINSFDYWRRKKRTRQQLRAWQVTSDARTDWLVNPEAFLEFHRGLSHAERRAVKPFLRRINARVLRTNEAAALRAHPTFQQLRQAMSRVDSTRTHTKDITHASYAAAQGIPFVGDNTFARWNRGTFGTSRHARGIPYTVQSIEDIANALGYK